MAVPKERKAKRRANLPPDHLYLTGMQKLTLSDPMRCHCQPMSYLYLLLLFLTALAVIITTTIVSHPCSLLATSRDQLLLPNSLRHQVSHIQTQLGSLLEQLHTDASDPKGASKYADRVLKIALSLDKFMDQLSRLPPTDAHANHLCEVWEPEVYFNETSDSDEVEDDISGNRLFLRSTEARSSVAPKPNRHGTKNFLGVETIQPSVGLSCAKMETNIDRFMQYKAHKPCPDDWELAQKLMLAGCDPLPRRKCFSKSPPRYSKPLPVSSSLWTMPNDQNILWSHYKCKGFSCLLSSNSRGFYKCSDCFNLSKRSWEAPSREAAEFTIDEVLALKPGEIRIGLDFSTTTGTFAALMKGRNVTIASATMNLGAPFNEVIALRGLLPLYVTVGSRLPFFDNTLDIIHSSMFLDGWIGLELLEYVMFDWDRVLRPKGILWVDRFFCAKDDMKIYLDVFGKLGYKKLLWKVVPKTDKLGNELFFSAVLEKPLKS